MVWRAVVAAIVAAVCVLQAWDSGVFGAGGPVIGLVLAGAASLTLAVALGAERRAGVPLLVAGIALIVVARVIAPVGLNELFVIFPIAVVPFLFDHVQRQRRRVSG